MPFRYNPPPNWPAPAPDWEPANDWMPDPAWGPPPDGWSVWLFVPEAPDSAAVLRLAGAWLGVAFVFGIGAAREGVAGGLIALGLVGLGVAAATFIKGRVAWAHVHDRTVGSYVCAAAVASVVIGGVALPNPGPRTLAVAQQIVELPTVVVSADPVIAEQAPLPSSPTARPTRASRATPQVTTPSPLPLRTYPLRTAIATPSRQAPDAPQRTTRAARPSAPQTVPSTPPATTQPSSPSSSPSVVPSPSDSPTVEETIDDGPPSPT